MRFDKFTIDEIDKVYPDILYPSKDAVLDAASHLIEIMQILKKQDILRTTLVGLTGGLAVMHHCPDRLPSIACNRKEDIDIVLDLADSTLEDLKDALLYYYSQIFIKHRQTLYMRTPGGKVRLDFKIIPANRKLKGMQYLPVLELTDLPFVNKIDLMTSKLYEVHPDPLPSPWGEPETARAIHHGTDALRLALLFDQGKKIILTMRQAMRVRRAFRSLENYTGIPGVEWLELFLVRGRFCHNRPTEILDLEKAFLFYTRITCALKMSYYDIDAILTDSQKLPCTFELDVPGLGILEGNPGENIKAGTRIDLPLWLGEMLSIGARLGTSRLVTLDLPSALSERVMNALKADPRTVDLRSLAPHFYSLSERILELFEEEELVEVLSNTFKKRSAVIADHAHNPQGALGQGADFLRGLDETERQLFRVAHDSAKETRVWAGEAKKK
ncbi:hypothetical protein CBS63078_2118 [Aspergillus niger]|nr:hypothetical protein CBS63078_2118 [Aspergillus niger]KAI3016862.1 hypothetical protein CBS147345_4514 [Aspergillus niger]KAI3072939.1 hypothetical protein CBS147353_6000 [Aspergillus niger]